MRTRFDLIFSKKKTETPESINVLFSPEKLEPSLLLKEVEPSLVAK